MMGTGNFNIKLARDQNPNMKFGISLLPGMEPGSSASFIGGDLVVVPKGSKRVNDAVDFMKFILSDEVQVEGYAKLLNLTTRADMVDNKYFKAEPLVQDVAKALTVGRTPYTLTFFEQINSPQGPWLQMLQTSILHRRPDRSDHQGRESANESDRRSVNDAAVRRARKERGDLLRRKSPTPRRALFLLDSREPIVRRCKVPLNELAAGSAESGHWRGLALRTYEGFADVQHSRERVSRRVISNTDCFVCINIHRLSVRSDGVDVASQLVFTRDEEMGWIGKFC